MQDKPVYRRVLLKISGEAIKTGLDKKSTELYNFAYVDEIVSVIKKCMDKGVQFAIIVGGGNIWRGRSSGDMDRSIADHMGMLATVMNCRHRCSRHDDGKNGYFRRTFYERRCH